MVLGGHGRSRALSGAHERSQTVNGGHARSYARASAPNPSAHERSRALPDNYRRLWKAGGTHFWTQFSFKCVVAAFLAGALQAVQESWLARISRSHLLNLYLASRPSAARVSGWLRVRLGGYKRHRNAGIDKMLIHFPPRWGPTQSRHDSGARAP